MEAEDMADEAYEPVLRVDAAYLVYLESRRNELLREEIALGKSGQQLLTRFKCTTNLFFVYLVFMELLLVMLMSSVLLALLMLTLTMISFGKVLWISVMRVKLKLNRLNYTRKRLIASQMSFASRVDDELRRLDIIENVDVGAGLGGPLISLRSFVAQAPVNEFEEIYREVKLFAWKKVSHCLLLLLVASLVTCFGIFDS